MKASVTVDNCTVERDDPMGGTFHVLISVGEDRLVASEMEFRSLVRAMAAFQLALRSSHQIQVEPSP